jgi:hypothetical protein
MHISFIMFERQTGVYIGSKIPQLHRKAIHAAVSNGNYLNSSDFIKDAIKENNDSVEELLYRNYPNQDKMWTKIRRVWLYCKPLLKHQKGTLCRKRGKK